MTRGGGNSNQRLSSKNPWAYLGNNAYQPPEFVTETVAPTTEDAKNFSLGTVWLVIPADSGGTDPQAEDIYFLAKTYDSSGDPNGAWVALSQGVIETLTGNSGGAVGRDGANNITIVGDGTYVNIVGDPGTNTLTMSIDNENIITGITGDSGGEVGPDSGNINIVGTGVITVVGDPGTNTLTITPDGSIASSFITNPVTGTATPVAGVLTFAGTEGITVTNASSTVTIDGASILRISGLTADDANTVTDTAGVINIAGGSNLTTTGTVGPNTLTISLDGITQYSVQVGGASDTLTQIANGTTGQVFNANTSANPTWVAAPDYEQSTFTPDLRFGGGTTGITYDTRDGYFIRIEDIIYYSVYIKLTSKGSSTGECRIFGFPYAGAAEPPYFDSHLLSMGTSGSITFEGGRYYGWFNSPTAAVTSALGRQGASAIDMISLNNTNFDNDSEFRFNGFYIK